MRRAITIGVLCGALALSGCDALGQGRYNQAVDEEQRLERVLDDALQLPDTYTGKEALIAEARTAEAEAERIRKALEGAQTDKLVGGGLGAAGKAARGDWLGAIEGIGGLIVAAGVAYAAARKKITSTVEDLEARRDATRTAQGIAPASARSSELQSSNAAQAARAAEEQALADQVARRMAAHLGMTPRHAEPAAGRHLSGGVGVPQGFVVPDVGVN